MYRIVRLFTCFFYRIMRFIGSERDRIHFCRCAPMAETSRNNAGADRSQIEGVRGNRCR